MSSTEMESRITILEAEVKELWAIVGALSAGASPPPPPPTGERTLPRGKYQRKTHDWVVKNDPSYVVFLADLDTWSSWGFTDEQLARARAACST